jgi:hypothetical protein
LTGDLTRVLVELLGPLCNQKHATLQFALFTGAREHHGSFAVAWSVLLLLLLLLPA